MQRSSIPGDAGFDALPSGTIVRVSEGTPRQFVVEALLGYGGMGAVYRAKDGTGGPVALKLLHDRFRSARAMVSRFAREAKLAAQVEHPNVLMILDAGVDDDGTPFLVSELLEGETFDARARAAGGRLPIDEVVRCADELLDVLAAAHTRGIVHRDIKPANLFRIASGELRVLDFGLAHAASDSIAAGEQLTNASMILGTAGFMAPELALGRWDLVGPQSDLWAVAATVLHLATGKYVHDAHTAQERLALSATRPAPLMSSRAPELPRALAAWLDRGLAFSKRDRFESARAMRAALALHGGAPATPNRRVLVAAGALVASAAAGGALAWAARLQTTSSLAAVPTMTEPDPAIAFATHVDAGSAVAGPALSAAVTGSTARAPRQRVVVAPTRPASVPAGDAGPVNVPSMSPSISPLDRRR